MTTLVDLENKYFASGVQHLGNTQVIPHLDANAYFAALQDALDIAISPDDVVYMSCWLIRPEMQLKPNVSQTLVNVLHDKAELGMDVRVIVWTGPFLTGGGSIDAKSWWDTAFAYAAEIRGKGFTDNVKNNINMVRSMRGYNPKNHDKPPLHASMLMDYGASKWGARHQKVAIVYHKATNDLRAFVGGIDPSPTRFGSPRHPETNKWHDAAVELRGGAAMAVWADFRTRWKEAVTLSNRFLRIEGQMSNFNNDETIIRPLVPLPPNVTVQSEYGVRILRSYATFKESPWGGEDRPWATLPPDGVREVLPTYIKAINAATPDPEGPPSYIYIEDQYLNTWEGRIEHDLLYPAIAQAVNRGVKVIFVVPGRSDPDDPGIGENRSWSITLPVALRDIEFDKWHNFVMYRVHNTMVHTKVVLINDEFLSIGSANFADRSMEGLDTELQAAIVTPGSLVRDFRVNLWADHLRINLNSSIADELGDLKKSLALFQHDWGTGVSFDPKDTTAYRLVDPIAFP